MQLAKGQIRETVRLPSGLERALEMRRDREMEREGGGEVFTLNDWDRPGIELGERARQRCYGRRDKWKTIDVSYDVGENHMGGGGLRLDTEQEISWKRIIL